jgi:hypothetical protein
MSILMYRKVVVVVVCLFFILLSYFKEIAKDRNRNCCRVWFKSRLCSVIAFGGRWGNLDRQTDCHILKNDEVLYVAFIIIKPTRCTYSSNLFWKWNSTCFGQFLCPSSGVIHWLCSILILLLESCLQTLMTYTMAVCTVNNSCWWTEELSETCRVSFPK